MYCVLWEYTVRQGAEKEFERAYGPEGPWVALFRQAPGWLETEIWRDPERPRRYLTIDRWTSREAHESCLVAQRAEYAAIDAACESLTERETRLGSFER